MGHDDLLTGGETGYWAGLMPIGAAARHAGLMADRLRLPAAQEMPAANEQIGQRAGHKQASPIRIGMTRTFMSAFQNDFGGEKSARKSTQTDKRPRPLC